MIVYLVSRENNKVDDRAADLEQRIGRFLLHFAEIEYQIYELLRLLPETKYSKFALRQSGFETRVRFCQLLVNSQNKAADEIVECLEQAITIFKFRNKIAHNPVFINIYNNPDTGDISALLPEWQCAKKKSALPHLNSELDGMSKKAAEVASYLYQVTSANHI